MKSQTSEFIEPVSAAPAPPRRDLTKAIAGISKFVSRLPRGHGAIPRKIGRYLTPVLRHGYVETRHGVRLRVVPGSLDVYTSMALENWSWNYWIMDTCLALLPDKGVFFDVGANVGYISLEIAGLKRRATIVSFEPQKELARNIADSAHDNGFDSVAVYDCCLGPTGGTVHFKRERHSIHAHVAWDDKADFKTPGETPMYSLDDLVSSCTAPAPDVIKIDVEGFEYGVLQGAIETIQKATPHIVFEYSNSLRQFGHKPSAIFELITELGDYTFYSADGSYRKASPTDTSELSRRVESGENLVTDILAFSRRKPRGSGPWS